ncbi:MAG: hypothetical protein OXH50_14035, partial [Gemmatimonadetes bacterium]|nr:hypothetical protein [Gemmatimonadota bacterium]
MSDPFTPLNIEGALNAGAGNVEIDDDWLWPCAPDDPDSNGLANMPAGEHRFWGIPFHLAPAGAGERFAVVSRAGGRKVPGSATVPVGARARRVLFAHVCSPCNGERATIEGAGEKVGAYRVLFEDGSAVEQELRRRFEIHDVNVPWGHHPFLCRNCREFRSVPLHDKDGPWGRNQVGTVTENGGDLEGWWLFDWENPHPDRRIEEIELTASGSAAVALGAVTLCDEAGDPLAWPARAAVAVTAGGGEEPELSMERGVIARQDALFVPEEGYLTSEESGWGLGGQEVRPGGYAEIHGSAEGRLGVRTEADGEEEIRWGDVLDSGAVDQGRVRVELVSPRGNQWVHVQVVDGESGRPVGTRVHFRSPQGAYIAPHGHQADINTAWFEDVGGDCKVRGTPYAYIDGTCQIDLPVGEVYVEAVRGFEYRPLRRKLEIKPGQRHLTLTLERAFDMK